MEIIFVGISNKADKVGKDMQPFDETTQSGKILSQIEERIQKKVLKTNLVPFTPTNSDGKIRYPTKTEIAENLPTCLEFLMTNTPCLVFLLGKIVKESVLRNIKSTIVIDNVYQLENQQILLAPIEHPSYIAVYKRKMINEYIAKIEECVNKFQS